MYYILYTIYLYYIPYTIYYILYNTLYILYTIYTIYIQTYIQYITYADIHWRLSVHLIYFWLYLQSLLVCAVPYKTALFPDLLTGCTNWYMYVYIHFWEKQPSCVTIWFYNFGKKWLGHDTLMFIQFLFIFHMGVTRYLYVFHLWNRGK